MTTANVHQDTSSATDTEDVVDTDANAPAPADEAREVLAKARYEAFRLMTDARQEAEEILDQARSEAAAIRKEAEMQAESIIDAAHMRAEEIRSEPAAPGAKSQLEQEHEELTERVSSLRSLADQLEERFAALAETAARRPTIEEPPRPVLDYSPSVPHPEPSVDADATTSEPSGVASDASAGPVLDYSPSVPRAQTTSDADTADEAKAEEPERGSFYSRRSAKLPRIGEAGGQNALDMMRSIRESFDDD